MRFKEELHAWQVYGQVAQQEGVSSSYVRRSIQAAIDDAWATTDPAAKAKQLEMFPNGKPSPAEFLDVVAGVLKDK